MHRTSLVIYLLRAAILPLLTAPPAHAELPTPCGNCGAGVSRFVTSGTANYAISGSVGTINQQSERAILNWQNFNVGAGNSVHFNQPSATAAALNRIHQQDPSRILGTINANGQVFLINQNGLLFGKDARVNTQALTASTLRVSDEVFNALGITGAINANPSAGLDAALPAFDGTANSVARIEIEDGAQLTASDRILVIAPEVINKGKLQTPGGQTILAGSKDKVYLATDKDLRGLLVEVDTGGSVSNLGEIVAERGNATLVGLAVNQSGRVQATTTVNVNGSIRLLARDRANTTNFTVDNAGARKPVATRAGTLTFGAGSKTEVIPANDGVQAVDAQPQTRSRVEAFGKSVHLLAGAQVNAPGGQVEITATSTPNLPLSGSDRSSKVVLEPGSQIDVSGDNTELVPMARNQASIRLFGNELADSPIQRNGILRGQEITVDLRRGTRVADVSKVFADVKRTVNERLSAGGSIALRSEGDVVLQPQSTVAFAGGQIRYLDGYLESTRLLRAGQVINIEDADPGVVYDGIFGSMDVVHRKWGISEGFRVFENGALSTFNAGYVEGKDAGSLIVSGNLIALKGDLNGSTVQGLWQRKRPESTSGIRRPHDEIPFGGELSVATGGIATATNLIFAATLAGDLFDFTEGLPTDLPLIIPSTFFDVGGITRLKVTTAGRVALPSDLSLALGTGGSFDLTATRIDFGSQLKIPGGAVNLTANLSGGIRGAVTLAGTAVIDVSGHWVNDLEASLTQSLVSPIPLAIDAGKVAISAQGDLTLSRGSLVNASAGAWRDRTGNLSYGVAGQIDLRSKLPADAAFTRLTLDGALTGHGFVRGGSLRLDAVSFSLGQTNIPGAVALQPSFFIDNGFESFSLNADRGPIELAPAVPLLISPLSRQLTQSALRASSGTPLADITQILLLPAHRRTATSLSATVARAPGVTGAQASVRIGDNGALEVQAGGTISLASDSDIEVSGSLLAPAGNVSLRLNTPSAVNERGYRANQSIYLGANARLDATGTPRISRDQSRLRQGDVLGGGNISLEANRGFIVGSEGSTLKVDGAIGVLDLPSPTIPGLTIASQIASDAGSITLRAAEGIIFAGALSGRAGDITALAGTLAVILDPNRRDPADIVATETNNPQFTQFPGAAREILLSGVPVVAPAIGTPIALGNNGKATLNAATIARGEFDNLHLNAEPVITFSTVRAPGRLTFRDELSLTLNRQLDLDAAVIAAVGGTSLLQAPLVSIGPKNVVTRATAIPSAGDGSLTFHADHIDLRNHVVFDQLTQNLRDTGLILSSSGDIRFTGIRFGGETSRTFLGSLTTLANVQLDGARIYPTTLTEYSFNLTGTASRLLINGAASTARAPHSAAGKLSFSAAEIVQGGTLLAPFGEIILNASRGLTLDSGSRTSASGAGVTTVFGNSEFGTDWVYELGDVVRVIDGTPEKRVSLTAPDIRLRAGSVVDISGGGDLLTFEFVPGPGGRRDLLAGDNPDEAFAILPDERSLFGIFDPLESSAANISIGSTITLAGSDRVPSGSYARLAPRYALLPGAFLVTPVNGTRDVNPLSSSVLPDGITAIVAGRLGVAGTAAQSARTVGYALESGQQVRARVEYNEFLASDFFASEIAGVPADAGQLSLAAEKSIQITGQLAAASAGGRGALVDIVAERLAVVNTRTQSTQRVELLASELQDFGEGNLFLGGVRRRDGDLATLEIHAKEVLLEENVTLRAPEVILAAQESVRLSDGSKLIGSGARRDNALKHYETRGDGALARVSVDDQVSFKRSAAPGIQGLLEIGSGALIDASGSITLESSREFVFAGQLSTSGGSVSLTASQINLGDTLGAPPGLSLSSAQLVSLTPVELFLNSASTVDIYAGATVQAGLLNIDAASLRGFGNSTDMVVVAAGTLRVTNSRDLPASAAGTGTGSLRVVGDIVEFAGGTFNISGFGVIGFELTDALLVSDENVIDIDGNLGITAPAITARAGAQLELTLDGSLTTLAAKNAPIPFSPELGGTISLQAETIRHAGAFVLPSGTLKLTATGAEGLTIDSGAILDLGGRDFDFGGRPVGSRGGSLTLSASQGDLVIGANALLRVAGGRSSGAAGHVTLNARNGGLQIDPIARLQGEANAAELQGSIALEAASLRSSFSSLNESLNLGGFTQARRFSVANGDFSIAATDQIRAANFTLSASGGRIEIAGNLIADSARGGSVRLYARDDLTLASTASLAARAVEAGNRGGHIELGTSQGTLNLTTGSRVDVRGLDRIGLFDDTGTVNLRATRQSNTGIGIGTLLGSIAGAARIDIEAFRSYSASTINTALISTIDTDNTSYFANATAIKTGLGINTDARYHLLPGVEIVSSGNLTLNTGWDLLASRFNGEAGVLTLRAGGDLALNQGLSDGFATTALSFFPPRDVVQTGSSWSYRLVGGADLSAANPTSVTNASGDVILASNTFVRSGTGSIDVASGGDLLVGSGMAAIYTAGVSRGTGALNPLDAEVLLRGDFLENGGDIRIFAGGNVVGIPARALPDYLPRAAGEFEFYAPGVVFPATWAVDPSKFRGVGALGGGDVYLKVGGDFEGLTIALPTNGMPLSMQNGDVSIAGGGDLSAEVGGAIRGGTFLLGKGNGHIRTEENLVPLPTNNNIAPVFALGDARISVSARSGIEMETVFNPTVAEQDPAQGLVDQFFFPQSTYFFTYSEHASASFETLSNDVTLNARGDRIANSVNDRLVDPTLLSTFPGSLAARSFERDILVRSPIDLLPSARGNLNVLAGRDITAIGAGTITQSDADIATLPTPVSPTGILNGVLLRQLLVQHAATPIHAQDENLAEVVARTGSIGTLGLDNLIFNISQQSKVIAAQDISNLSLAIQHARESDRSELVAGRDILYTTRRRLDGRLSENNGLVSVAGPGVVDLLAGRNVDFGASRGLESRGNLGNPALLASGVDVNVWIGQQSLPDFAAFAEQYITRAGAPYTDYLQAYLEAQGETTFEMLNPSQQRESVLHVFFQELEKSGLESTRLGNSFARGESAIATLFPLGSYPGDIRSFLSRITTLDGGNINLVVPGGLVNAGVASTGSIAKDPSELGIVVQSEGDIRAYTRGDFLVNASRVFALDGGDILIWSAQGNIDAGRGARSALSIPPPTTTFDAQGNVVIEFPAAIAGSGIQAAVSSPGRAPGDVFLFAPRGVVDAGDAGISSAGNLTIAATAVLGADNISVGGASTGVPTTAVSVPVGLASASSAASSATKSATAGASEQFKASEDTLAKDLGASLASIISVQFIGFGE